MPKFTEDQLQFMREDIASNFALSKIIEKTKIILKSQGKDFNTEFAKWKKQQYQKGI